MLLTAGHLRLTGNRETIITSGLPWYLWCAAAAATAGVIGSHWDISWHRSIGRDTFWTPAHMLVQSSAILAGIVFGFLILNTTFSRSAALASSSVHIWGFRAPLGAFIAAWGGTAMLTSAPFDNWWHEAYGLDVRILSPPHVVLLLGGVAVLFGTLVLIAAQMNRTTGAERNLAQWLFLYVAGMVTAQGMIVILELTPPRLQHSSIPYLAVSFTVPIVMALGHWATGKRFVATFLAAFYTLLIVGLILVLPLFPAQPKLGPVYQNVTRFIPPHFPLLLVVPALLIDSLWQKAHHWGAWKVAFASGALFVIGLVAVEWPFANFLISPASHNRFFGTMYFPYSYAPSSDAVRGVFSNVQSPAQFWMDMAVAVVIASLTVRLGRALGEWMGDLQR